MNSHNEDPSNRLLAEQLEHTLDLIRGELSATRTDLEHFDQMSTIRLKILEEQSADFEKRLRELTESATQFKLLVSLALGGGVLSLVELLRGLLHP